MTRRRWALLGLTAMTLAVLVVVALDALRPTTAIPPERIARLETGMTRAEAEAIVGMPPGDYATRFSTLPFKGDDHQMVWRTDELTLFLQFNLDGTLVQTATIMPNPETVWQRLRRWTGL